MTYAGIVENARVIGIVEQNRLADSAESNGGSSLVLVLDRTRSRLKSVTKWKLSCSTIRSDQFSFEVRDSQEEENDTVLHVSEISPRTGGCPAGQCLRRSALTTADRSPALHRNPSPPRL